jgi:hypothetical protein
MDVEKICWSSGQLYFEETAMSFLLACQIYKINSKF